MVRSRAKGGSNFELLMTDENANWTAEIYYAQKPGLYYPAGEEGETKGDLSRYTGAQAGHHMALLIEAGLVKGKVAAGSLADEDDEPPFILLFGRLTWAGHDFLDAARSEPVWRKALAKAKDVGSTVSLTF
jgi:hypothetical protein